MDNINNLFKFSVVSLLLAFCLTQSNASHAFKQDKQTKVYTKYTPQNLGLKELFRGFSIKIKITKFREDSPIDFKLIYFLYGLQTEIESNGGIVVKENEISDLSLNVKVSQFIMKKYGKSWGKERYRTLIDFEYDLYSNIENKRLDSHVHSIEGAGESPSLSNLDALNRFVKKVLLNENLHRFLSSFLQSQGGIVMHSLNKLAAGLLKDFERGFKNFKNDRSIRIAFIAFKAFNQDNENLFTNIFLSSLTKFWKAPRYRFYTRDELELDRIIRELKFQGSGLIDESTIVAELGKLKAVDFLITGNASNFGGNKIIQVKIVRLEDGEVISSNSTSIKWTK